MSLTFLIQFFKFIFSATIQKITAYLPSTKKIMETVKKH